VTRDVANGPASIAQNHVLFDKYDNLSDADRQKAWREFYFRWIVPPNGDYLLPIPESLPNEVAGVRIDEKHWNLLEANLALGLKLYAQGLEVASSRPVRGASFWVAPSSFSLAGFVAAVTQAVAYKSNMNVFEQALLGANTSATGRRWYSSGRPEELLLRLFSETVYGTDIYQRC
jgi:hypothetical protein